MIPKHPKRHPNTKAICNAGGNPVPGNTSIDLVRFVASGTGASTTGVRVAVIHWSKEFAITYLTGDAVPENEGRGSNVTVPSPLTE